MDYLHDDVFLTSDIAKELYHNTAAQAPVIDFHTHLHHHTRKELPKSSGKYFPNALKFYISISNDSLQRIENA